MLHSSSSPSGFTHCDSECMSLIFVMIKFKRAHLKFTVYSRKQASKLASIHTHMRNAVTLVWGSVRLTPIKKSRYKVKCMTSLASPSFPLFAVQLSGRGYILSCELCHRLGKLCKRGHHVNHKQLHPHTYTGA